MWVSCGEEWRKWVLKKTSVGWDSERKNESENAEV